LRSSVARLCCEARQRELRAEQLIIAVKYAWATLPDTQWWRRESDLEVLPLVITVCIEQFFLHRKAAPGASG
jgi:hypothetical protein